MGCGASSRPLLSPEQLAAEATEARSLAAEQAQHEQPDSEFVIQSFQKFIGGKLLQLTAARDDVATELRAHAKHDLEFKRAQTAVSHSTGALGALEVLAAEKSRRAKLALEGKEVGADGKERNMDLENASDDWVCKTCTSENEISAALCKVCNRQRYGPGPPGRLRALSVLYGKSSFYGILVWARRALKHPFWRFSDRAVAEGPKRDEAEDRHAVAMRKHTLRARAREAMATTTATAAAAKMQVVSERRLRALRTVLAFLDEVGKPGTRYIGALDPKSDLVGSIVADAEAEALEAETQMLLLEQTLKERVLAKAVYLRAKGAMDFALAPENAIIFEDPSTARRAAIVAFQEAETDYIHKAVARRDGIKATKDRAAIAAVQVAAARALAEGLGTGRAASLLKDEELELARRAPEYGRSAAVYKATAPRMYAALGALRFLVEWKERHESSDYERNLQAIVEEAGGAEAASTLAVAQGGRSKVAVALRALDQLDAFKTQRVLKVEVEVLAIAAAASEGVINVARLARLRQLASTAGLALIQDFLAITAPSAAATEAVVREQQAQAELAAADVELQWCGDEEAVLDRARDAKSRKIAACAALAHIQTAWDQETARRRGPAPKSDWEAAWAGEESPTANKEMKVVGLEVVVVDMPEPEETEDERKLYAKWLAAGAEERAAAAASELVEGAAAAVPPPPPQPTHPTHTMGP
jgi:hypothetical protein